jgi:hypothetical protein
MGTEIPKIGKDSALASTSNLYSAVVNSVHITTCCNIEQLGVLSVISFICC